MTVSHAKMDIMPDKYRGWPKDKLNEKIRAIKEQRGKELVILAHHYQRQDIVELGDLCGDSFGLSKAASELDEAKYIVFCGVNFMAESAAILAKEGQRVFHPDFEASCPMADMAEEFELNRAWEDIASVIGAGESDIIPLTYMNSHGSLKAFCGARGGSVVTSSNAPNAFEWALGRAKRIFFFPDEHLGRNTAHKLGIDIDKEFFVWDPEKENGGLDPNQLEVSKVIAWKGFCHIHTWFTTEHIRDVREKHPDVKVVVHPECTREVVEAADADGSTEFIRRYVKEARRGSAIAIGTEINLVGRLARDNPDKKVIELSRSLCPNMYRVNLHNLLWTLEELPNVNEVIVEDRIKDDAALALKKMLEIT